MDINKRHGLLHHFQEGCYRSPELTIIHESSRAFFLFIKIACYHFMDRVIIKCKKCGRFLMASSRHGTRRCAICGAMNKINEMHQETFPSPKAALEFIRNSGTKRDIAFTIEGVRRIKRRAKRT
ncbi:MAG: hypothetical protein ACTSVI_04660 [Promethearchaeota archaeon]